MFGVKDPQSFFPVYAGQLSDCNDKRKVNFLQRSQSSDCRKGLTIALAITLRYFPFMREEWAYIRGCHGSCEGYRITAAGLISHLIQNDGACLCSPACSCFQNFGSRLRRQRLQEASSKQVKEKLYRGNRVFNGVDLLAVIAYAAVAAGMVYAGMKGVF